MAAKKPALKIPKSVAAAADMYWEMNQKRLAMQREVDAIEADEKALKEHLINAIPKSQATGVAGKFARVTVVTKDVPTVTDWDAFYGHVAKNKAKGGFALLGRRLSDTAIREIWDSGKQVPGVGHFTAVTLSVSRVK